MTENKPLKIYVVGKPNEKTEQRFHEVAKQMQIEIEITYEEPTEAMKFAGKGHDYIIVDELDFPFTQTIWDDEFQLGSYRPVNAPYGPQPKGKKGKVRKW